MTTQARELAKLVSNAGDLNFIDDITLGSDGALLNFGADSDVVITHVADTGLLLNSSRQLQFGDSGTFIRQEADGVLDLTSDTEIELNATTLDINANVDISGTLAVAGNLDFGDAVLSNVGAVQLDSITGDGDTNTSITFSGSDVITIATGGSGRLTIGDGALSPVTDNQIDLGTSSLEFKDAFFDGTVTSDAFAGPLTGNVTGNVSGTAATVTTAAQTNITSLGTLTGLTTSGNVGIGVTPEANWRSSVKALDLGATGAFWDGHNYSIFANNVYEHTDTDRKHKQNGFGSSIEQYLGTISLNRTTSGSADAVISGSTTMFLDTSGNVGIGITTPNESGFGATSNVLSVAGTAQDAFGVLELISTDVTSSNRIGEIRFGNLDAGSSFASNAGIRATRDGADNSSALSLWTTNAGTFAEAVRIAKDGKVGIGQASPSAALHITGSGDTKLILEDGSVEQSITAHSGGLNYGVVSGDSHTFVVDTTDEVFINATGLGIGAAPGAPLDVNSGSTNTMAHFHSTDDNGFIELKDDNTTAYIGVQDDYMYIGGVASLSTQNLVINDGAGKVGIGTTSPSCPLEIVDSSASAPGTALKVYSAQNSAASDGLVFIHSDQALAPFTALNVRQDGTGDVINLLAGTTEVMSVTDDGDVFFGGTDQASTYLCVGRVSGNASQGNGHIQLKSSGASYMDWWDAGSGNSIRLHTHSVNLRMVDQPNGDPCIQFEAAGNIDIDGSYLTGGFDYAEYFESTDGSAIPVGTSVVLVNEKVRAATSGEQPLGVVRPGSDGTSVVGGSAGNRWVGKYLKDDYDAYLYDTVDFWVFKINGEDKQCWSDRVPDGWTVPANKKVTAMPRKRLNPDFVENLDSDGNQVYANRESRDEWNCIGLLGQVPITKGQVTNSNWTKLKDRSASVELWFIK